MRYDHHLLTKPWEGYELIDSGENMKLERFGAIVTARPETQALWAKRAPERWEEAHARFAFGGETKGSWDVRRALPEDWEVPWEDLRLGARLTNFKHTGIFPEQAPNWDWSRERIRQLDAPKVLNLFGYTGAASIVAALAGAKVTHVDASKQALDWANENAQRSGLPHDAIRWLLDDVLTFAKREMRRGNRYEGIILDPPAFGRGAKGEVWKIEEDLPALLSALRDLLSDVPGSFFLVSGYAAGYAPCSLAQAVESAFGDVAGECGELHIEESGGLRATASEERSVRVIPAGIYVRFVH